MENNEQTVEETTEEQTTEETVENQTDYKALAEKAQAETAKYKAIAERKTKTKEKSEDKLPTREELVLIAKGASEDELAMLDVIAKKNGVNLAEATKDPDYLIWKEGKDTKKASEEAQLGTSAGSPNKKPFEWGSLTDEEHKAKFQERVNA